MGNVRAVAAVVGAASFLFLAPGTARASARTDLHVSLALEREECPLGETVELQVTIRNAGTQETHTVIEPTLDRQSVSFEITMGPERRAFYTRIYDSPHQARRWPRADMAPGDVRTVAVPFPAVAAGSYSIRAIYNGFQRAGGEPADPLYSDPATLTVTAAEGQQLVARITTSMGEIVASFYAEDALNTVVNFVRLARDGFYDGRTFHRIIPNFMVQGGCPRGDGSGDAGWSVHGEFNAHHHTPGVFSMARSQSPHSAGSQFFICTGTPAHLDGQYTAFGETVEGLSVVQAIGAVRTGPNDRPVQPVTIESIRIEVRGGSN